MKDFACVLKGVRTAAIAGHIRPDGDCVGSCLATYNYIKTYYSDIDVTLYLEPIPNIFKFLAKAGEIEHSFLEEREYDLFIVQDCGDEGRLGGAAAYFRSAKKTVCIDHHISNSSFADENYIVPGASSTSELVFGLIGEEQITKEIAECIYVGIVHDTGVFQYSSTSAKTMEIAGKLMEKGIDFPKIIEETFYAKTFAQNRILGKALLKSRLYAGGRVIASYVTKAEMEEFEALPKHLDGIVNQLLVTKGAEAAIFLYETEDGGPFKVSTRSHGFVNVAEIAVSFGGGGHVQAAGFSMQGEPESVIQAVVTEMQKQL